MAWVVDSCVLLDIRMNDPAFGLSSAQCLVDHLHEGLVIAPMTYVELAPAFRGDSALQGAFLEQNGVDWMYAWTRSDTDAAHRLWADHVQNRPSGHGSKRPIADVFIEAFAKRFQGLITRNARHFATVTVVVP